MKKIMRAIIALVICVASVFALSGCSASAPKDSMPIPTPRYSEDKLRESIASVKPNNVNFASAGASEYVIVYPDIVDTAPVDKEHLTPSERERQSLKTAVEFLKSSLERIVGDDFLAIPKSGYASGECLELLVDSGNTQLKNGGYSLEIEPRRIVITGAEYVGVTNGIYSFLEKNLGCMFVSYDYDYLPKLPTINFERSTYLHSPDMVWRNVYAGEVEDNSVWSDKLRLNGTDFNEWGNWCHTVFTYVPPEEFFETHPEYFSEYNGVRKYENGPVSGQLCLTNEDVYKIVSTRLFDMMAKNPDVNYWDVSQMDTWINRGTGCTCDKCKALDDAEGSPMGSILTFINRLADECAEKFPNNYISTLAYNYSETPPKTLRPRDNVIIKLCFMPGDVTSDIASPRNKEAEKCKKIITEWSNISKHLLIWDYNVDFHQYLMPYPIFSAIQANNEFYLDNNVYGVFHQIDRDTGGYGAEISAYVFAQIMWDRTAKVEDILDKYLSVYYGAAAEPMAEYYSTIENNAYKANRELYIYSTVFGNTRDYLSASNVDKYLEMFERAESLAKGDNVIISRIKRVKMSALYVKSQEVSLDKSGRLSALNEFKAICDDNGIESVYEGNPDKDNEVETFYAQQLSVINAIPWIITAICTLVIGVAIAITLISRRIIKGKTKKNI